MNKKISFLMLTAALSFISLFYVFRSSNLPALPSRSVPSENSVEGSSITPVPSVIYESNFQVSAAEGQQAYRVVKVVDGDTIDVDIDGVNERVRIIGIDTPEIVDPQKPAQCFGEQARAKAIEILSGKFVTLEADVSQGDTDKYNRLLRFIFLQDGSDYGLHMISEGYAHEYTYDAPYKYQSQYKQAEIDAVASKRGLWGECKE